MASIVKRRTKRGTRYDVRYRTPNGTARTKTFPNRRDADRFRSIVEADKYRGDFVDARLGRVKLAQYATRWFDGRPDLRPRTRETYESQLRLHILPELGDIEVGQLSPTMVRAWRTHLH